MHPSLQKIIEERGKEFDKEFTSHNLRDDLSEQKVARYIKSFNHQTATLAFEAGVRAAIEALPNIKTVNAPLAPTQRTEVDKRNIQSAAGFNQCLALVIVNLEKLLKQ